MCKTCGCKDAETLEAEKINTFSEIENEWKDSSVTIYDEDADEFYGVKEILVQEGDDVLEDGHPYLVLNKDSGDLDSQVFYRDFQTGYDAESFEATSDELDCPSCKATPKERMGEPLCSTCNSCFECCEILCEDESFEAHDHSHIYPSEELTPSHSHSSETFKSSNNNTNTMAAESKFDKLSDKIAKQYRKKGMSAKEAKEIGNKTAYTIGRKKYGKAGMAKKARAGMRAESFEAQGNPDKRTTTQYAKFYVGFEDDEGELRGGGKFKKYNDAVSQAEIVSKREGNSRIVTTRGFALWTDDGKGMWQEGYDKTVAKEFYSAEGYSIGSGFRLGFGLGLGMLALSTVTTIVALAASTIDERQVE